MRQWTTEHPEAAAPLALPQVPDPTYYSASELDVYPRPLTTLMNLALHDGMAGRMRFTLLIDEHGVVNRVAALEGAPPARFEEGLRAMLAATRFEPARKDGRPVKSRVLIDLGFGAARQETVTGDQ